MIQTRPLFELRLDVPEVMDLGDTPSGRRRVAPVRGGTFAGERLNGEVLEGGAGDWLLQRADGVMLLDVRLLLRTDAGELVSMSYRGVPIRAALLTHPGVAHDSAAGEGRRGHP